MLVFPVVIASIQDDDDRLFMETLYTTHHAMMYRIALKYAPSQTDADDIVSDACLSLINKLSRLRQLDDGALLGYVNIAVRNTAISFLRKRSQSLSLQKKLGALHPLQEDEPGPDAALIRQCTVEEIMTAMRQLSETDRSALYMKYWLDLDAASIADHLGIQEPSVRSFLSRARKKLYTHINAEHGA